MDEPAGDPDAGPGRDGPIKGWSAAPRQPWHTLLTDKTIAALVIAAILSAFTFGLVTGFLFASDDAAPGSMFGDPYDELPADFRVGIEARLEAVAPLAWDRLSVDEKAAWAGEQVRAGRVRLDDSTLTRWFQLNVLALSQMPVADCAAFAQRETPSPATYAAFQAALSPVQRQQRVEIDLQAIEAQARGAPIPRTVIAAEIDRLEDAAVDLATPEELNAIKSWNGDASSQDSIVCTGWRATLTASLRLPQADLATLARYQAQP